MNTEWLGKQGKSCKCFILEDKYHYFLINTLQSLLMWKIIIIMDIGKFGSVEHSGSRGF